MTVRVWCEHCRDHFPTDHYTTRGHKVGAEWGQMGERLAAMEELPRLRERCDRAEALLSWISGVCVDGDLDEIGPAVNRWRQWRSLPDTPRSTHDRRPAV